MRQLCENFGCRMRRAARDRAAGGPCDVRSRTTEPFVLLLKQVTEDQRPVVGGKAANLARLMRARLPVPPGFCVTTAAFAQFVAACPRQEELLAVLAQPSTERLDDVSAVSRRALACLADIEMPPRIEQEILAAWRAQGEHRHYAVRSSAVAEDAEGHSFAGQFESFLNVRGKAALLASIKGCWLSRFSPRALAYEAKQGLPRAESAMAVVVQEMVPATTAGVLFTVDPVTGSAGRMVIEGAQGLGDRLVSGRVDPERVVLEKSTLRVRHPRSTNDPACLDRTLVRQLGRLARKAERLFGSAQDIEWAVAQGHLYILQARPITAGRPARSWEERQVWTNLNAGEVFPDVATPLTWSLSQCLLGPLFRSVFRLHGADGARAPLVGLVAGRIYINANTGLAALKPFSFLLRSIPNAAQALGGGHIDLYERGLLDIPSEDLPDLGFRWPRYLLSWPWIPYELITHLPRRGDAWCARLKVRTDALVCLDVGALPTPDLARSFSKLLRESAQDWDLIYLATQAAALLVFQKACRDWLGDLGLGLGYRLFSALGSLPETEAGLALWRLAALAHADPGTEAALLADEGWQAVRAKLGPTEHGRQFLAAWEAFMSRHGHHCRGELELFNARWSETPDYILGLVRGYLRALDRTDPLENQRRLAHERARLTEDCCRRLNNPVKRWIFSRSLRRAQRLAINREEWKNQAVRQFGVLRQILLALGDRLWRAGVLAQPDDIFFLEVGEIEPVGTGQARFDIRAVLSQRREEYAKNLPLNPPQVVVGRFDPNAQPASAAEPTAMVLKGIPVFPGTVSGPARVVLRADDHAQVLAGEILVAPFTDPAWTPYFVPAAGVVIDQGGILSHGSIVAREYGLPTVTNVGSATRIIRTGDLVQVDGTRGEVSILSRG